MHERFEAKVVSRLAEDISHLSGGMFEQFGYKVMGLVQPGDWQEKGTTIDGAVRKGTVDTTIAGAAYAGQMSSNQTYFDAPLDKPRKDLAHTLSLHPQAKQIWLLSSRTQSAAQTTAVDNLIADFLAAHPTVQTAAVLDAREIAKHVFRYIGKHDLVRSLSTYLQSLRRLAEEHAFSHGIPSIAGLIPRTELEQRVLGALDGSAYVVLRGMSGAGKTAIAARLAQLQRSSFDNVIWHDARKLDRVEKLSHLDMTGSGVTHNVTNLLRHEGVLLILDDPAFPP